MNWWLLWATSTVLRKKTNPWALWSSAALGAVCAFVWLLSPLTLMREVVLKGAVAGTMAGLCFRPKSWLNLLKYTALLLALSAFSAGITYALALSGTTAGEAFPSVGWYLIASGPLLLSLPLKRMWSSLAVCFSAVEVARRFRFRLGGATIELTAVLDTGNTLLEPFTFRPVVVVDTSAVVEHLPPELRQAIVHWQAGDGGKLCALPDSIIGRVTLIPYTTVAASGLMFAVRPELCEVESKGAWQAIEAVVAFAVGEVRLCGRSALLPHALWPLS